MKEPRFYVREVEGWPVTKKAARRSTRAPGLTAHVLDRLHQCRLVRAFRSENYRGSHERARLLAYDLAEALNQIERQRQGRERTAAYRERARHA